MHFATVFILGAAVVSASASLVVRQSLPGCYSACVAKADLGSCSSTDTVCLCKDSAFVAATTTCIETTCKGDDLQNSISDAQAICAAVGVTLSAPTATSTGTDSSTGTVSSTGAASSTGAVSSTGAASSTGAISSGTPASSATSSGSAPATTSSAAAVAHGANTFIGLAAVGLVALAL